MLLVPLFFVPTSPNKDRSPTDGRTVERALIQMALVDLQYVLGLEQHGKRRFFAGLFVCPQPLDYQLSRSQVLRSALYR